MVKKWLGQLAFVWVPCLLAVLYWGVFASDRYEAEAKFIVQRSGPDQTAGFDIASLVGSGTSGNHDALVLKEYILSPDMLDHLNRELQVLEHYSDMNVDPLARLSVQASREDALEYFRNRVTVYFDAVSGVTTLRAQAFAPDMSQRLVREIVQQSERFTNRVGQRLAEEQMDFVSTQLQRAQSQMRDSTQAMLSFQNEHNLVSPKSETDAVGSIVAMLESELAGKQAEIKSVTTFLNNTAPEVVRLRSEISSLQSQIKAEKAKLVGGAGKPKLNDLGARFEDMQLTLQFGADIYKSALSALEAARVEASRKLKHLVIVQEAALPDEALYPRRIYNLVTFFAITLMVYWIGRLAIATIKDHRD